ncbi:hypothetical protein CCACVL1_13365 [Corchorus capsularis]|uniref:HpcH/HpaI aldolase/citrate lyase domain-containing protein n=1 Tax=Corchorus capsularis TaxID=210143 RepID=A0A1R3IBA7_COCAP|nr:hypothetical protein CCACVL1_13365 [Corchorus capsularis]
MASLPPTSKSLKARLNNGDTLYGIFLLSFSPTLAEISGLAGYDFVVVDMEHGHGGISQALPCLQALSATQTPAILRLPENSPSWAKKALDLGPDGLMFPLINDPESAKAAVASCRYPPAGIRGNAHSVVRASKYGLDSDYLEKYERELLIMCQVESEEAAKRAGDIAAVEGVDCVMIGPSDLSASMGYIRDPWNKKVKEIMEAAESRVLGSGEAYLAGFSRPYDSPNEMRKRGYNIVCGGVDLALFRNAVVEDVKKFKNMV